MEESKGEVVFDSLNLDPHLFINEALNVVDDLVGDAFDFYQSYASLCLVSSIWIYNFVRLSLVL